MGRNGLAQLRFDELLARDVGQHHAVAPRKHYFALAAAFGVHKALVGAQCIQHGMGVVASLGEGGFDGFGLAAGGVQNRPVFLVGLHDGAQAKVFDFQNQQAPAGVQHDEIRVQLLGADGYVVPEQVVVVEFVFQPLGQALFSKGHAPQARTQCRYQCRHAASCPPMLCTAYLCMQLLRHFRWCGSGLQLFDAKRFGERRLGGPLQRDLPNQHHSIHIGL